MPRYAALLRAINVGGHVVKMDRLRELFAEAGYAGAETLIASGNVIFEARGGNAASHERAIERHLEAALGYEVATFVRTPAELAAIAALQPFGADDGRTLNVTFYHAPLDAESVERLMSFRSATDDFRVIGRESYWACGGRTSDSPFGKARPDKRVLSTTRNMTTVRKLAEKLAR